MLGRLNHVAIAVPDIEAASAIYRDTLGAKVSAPQVLPDHGVTVVFIDTGNTKVELLEPLGEGSPIAAFLEKNPSGGMHHVCYEVDDILAARDRLWQPENRRAWQARALPASQGLLRYAGGTGASVSVMPSSLSVFCRTKHSDAPPSTAPRVLSDAKGRCIYLKLPSCFPKRL